MNLVTSVDHALVENMMKAERRFKERFVVEDISVDHI